MVKKLKDLIENEVERKDFLNKRTSLKEEVDPEKNVFFAVTIEKDPEDEEKRIVNGVFVSKKDAKRWHKLLEIVSEHRDAHRKTIEQFEKGGAIAFGTSRTVRQGDILKAYEDRIRKVLEPLRLLFETGYGIRGQVSCAEREMHPFSYIDFDGTVVHSPEGELLTEKKRVGVSELYKQFPHLKKHPHGI